MKRWTFSLYPFLGSPLLNLHCKYYEKENELHWIAYMDGNEKFKVIYDKKNNSASSFLIPYSEKMYKEVDKKLNVYIYELNCIDIYGENIAKNDIIIYNNPKYGIQYAKYISSHGYGRSRLKLIHNEKLTKLYNKFCYKLNEFKIESSQDNDDEDSTDELTSLIKNNYVSNDGLSHEMNNLDLNNSHKIYQRNIKKYK